MQKDLNLQIKMMPPAPRQKKGTDVQHHFKDEKTEALVPNRVPAKLGRLSAVQGRVSGERENGYLSSSYTCVTVPETTRQWQPCCPGKHVTYQVTGGEHAVHVAEAGTPLSKRGPPAAHGELSASRWPSTNLGSRADAHRRGHAPPSRERQAGTRVGDGLVCVTEPGKQ